jgi:hypothetical protein
MEIGERIEKVRRNVIEKYRNNPFAESGLRVWLEEAETRFF